MRHQWRLFTNNPDLPKTREAIAFADEALRSTHYSFHRGGRITEFGQSINCHRVDYIFRDFTESLLPFYYFTYALSPTIDQDEHLGIVLANKETFELEELISISLLTAQNTRSQKYPVTRYFDYGNPLHERLNRFTSQGQPEHDFLITPTTMTSVLQNCPIAVDNH